MAQQAIDSSVLEILRAATCDGLQVKLAPQKLDRNTYEAVSEVLTRLGGKWKGGKTAAHVFPYDISEQFNLTLETGLMPPKNPMAFFATPVEIAKKMVSYIGDNCKRILEPSAGTGAIADQIKSLLPTAALDVVELDPYRAAVLKAKSYEVHEQDFLSFTTTGYDAILMNPPFAVDGDKSAYITHINHAYSLLAPGGRLVAIAPGGLGFRADKKTKQLREMVEAQGSWTELSEGAFKESGTGVRTVLVVLDKPAIAELPIAS